MKKVKRMCVRVNEREHELIVKKAKKTGNSVTDILVNGALNAVFKDKEALSEFIQILKKYTPKYKEIGNKVNQITTKFNILTKTNSNLNQSDLDEMILIFEELKFHQEKLLEEMRRIKK